MRLQSAYAVLSTMAISASAIPQPLEALARTIVVNGQGTLPQNDPNPKSRAAAVQVRNEGFVYGPSLIGEAAPFPNGTLGNARAKADYAVWQVDREEIDARIAKDVKAVTAAIAANGGLKSLDDYARVLYENQWKYSNPRSTAPGIMSNYTQDLLFSMERLSQNPYPLRAIKTSEGLPFQVADELVRNITTLSLKELQAKNLLFYVDHREQLRYPKTTVEPKRYGAAVQAYFYIHPQSKDFLPLAVKTNVGKDLVYTPLDQPNDWMLAKLMFNVNDMFHSQMLHLVISHDVSEAVHQAALHTLSDSHPVMIILERLMLQGYSSRVVGEELCFNPGGHWDQLMYVNNVGCRKYVTEQWPVTGRYQTGYLHNDLRARGLINDKNKSVFKSFPYYQDADEIHAAYAVFFKTFVDSYYKSDADLAKDYEVQNWFVEATKHAKVQDFPQLGQKGKPVDKKTLIEVLTHFGFSVSVGHHALNGGDPTGSKATLPFHLPALYAPVPEAKGVKDLLPFMPPAPNAVHYIGFIASFNRPFYETSQRTVGYAFSEAHLLGRLNMATRKASELFQFTMRKLSDKIRHRTFDKDGLSLGMPFVYRTLDPDYIPFFCSV